MSSKTISLEDSAYSKLKAEKRPNERKEFDMFVQKAQEHKMKELWGEGDYSGWEHA